MRQTGKNIQQTADYTGLKFKSGDLGSIYKFGTVST